MHATVPALIAIIPNLFTFGTVRLPVVYYLKYLIIYNLKINQNKQIDNK